MVVIGEDCEVVGLVCVVVRCFVVYVGFIYDFVVIKCF